jgi:2,4-dienoyl-CoA reductase (NADPH2)
MAFAINASERGHRVTLFEADAEVGGQLNMARVVPGKNEFNEMLRYFKTRLSVEGVELRLGRKAAAAELAAEGFDEIILATGVRPRRLDIAGIDHPKVLSYVDVLALGKQVGRRVAIIGAGGIGFDTAEYLLGDARASLSAEVFLAEWQVDTKLATDGGLLDKPSAHVSPKHEIFMLQRKQEKLGARLGKSTGWILKARLLRANVEMISSATYHAIDDQGLHYSVDGERRLLAVDNVIICAGQESERALYDELRKLGATVRVIGGADVASELDALRAIDQATRLAVAI